MAIGAAGESGVAQVLGVVAGLLERAEDERREGFTAAARAVYVIRDSLAHFPHQRGRGRGRELLRCGRRRHVEIGELPEQKLDRLRVRAFVDPVERLASPAGEELGHGLVRRDHQLLDQAMRGRFAFLPGTRDPAFAVELEVDLGRFDAERAPCEPPVPHPRGEAVGELERCDDLRRRLPSFCFCVRQSSPAPDDRAVELRLALRWHLDGETEPVLVRTEAAAVLGELRWQHRCDSSRYVCRERALCGAAIERHSSRQIGRHVGDVHPPPEAIALLLNRDRVVEVLRGLGVDRESELVAQVDPVGQIGIWRVVGLELGARAGVHEQSLEDDLDVLRLAELALDSRASAAGADDNEISRADVAAPLAVDRDRNIGDEVRLADEQLAALVDLYDEEITQTLRKRRMVKPEPAAPRSSPVPRRISAFSEKAIAFTSLPALSGPLWSSDGKAISLPITSSSTAPTAPAMPQSSPSSMKGPRTNQLVAPTSFITSISRRREKIDRRIVFAISKVDAASRRATAMMKKISITCASFRT